MKFSIIFLTLFLIYEILNAQHTFELKLEESLDQEPTSITTINGDIMIGINSMHDDNFQSSKILKISRTGEIIDSLVLSYQSPIRIKEFVPINGEEFYCIGGISDETSHFLWIGRLKSDLEIIEEKIIIDIGYRIYQTHSLINDNIVIAGFGFNNDIPQIFLIKLDLQFNIIYKNIFYEEESAICTDILYEPGTDKYFLFTYMGFFLYTIGQIAILDNAFNLDTVIPTPKNFNYQYTS